MKSTMPDSHICSYCKGEILEGFDMPPTCNKCKREFDYPPIDLKRMATDFFDMLSKVKL